MMQCLARSGSGLVVASGQITAFQGAPLEVEFFSGPDVQFAVRWEFEHDDAVEDVAVSLHIEDQTFRLICVNFDAADGRGTGKPLQLHEDETRRYWLHFRVFLFGKTIDRTVHYTVYEERLNAPDAR